MNNSDFRALLGADSQRQTSSASPNGTSHKPSSSSASTLGGRSRAFVPMTPRAIAGSSYQADFARQLAERNTAAKGLSNNKKARSPAVPKGTKLAAGYTDRAATRVAEEQDEKAARIKALEEQMKLGQIEVEVFEKMRDQITGGDIGATHLVKGLDRQLLERIRRGEDVLSGDAEREGEKDGKGDTQKEQEDFDDAFEQLEEKEIAPVVHEQVVKKGEMAPPPPVAGVKRSRNDILAELKAARKAAQEAAAAESQLGNRFKKIGDKKSKEPRIERDEKGREVLITVDEYGRVKRKIRKVAEEPAPKARNAAMTKEATSNSLLMPDKALKPLGMEVPDLPTKASQVEDEDDDIFAGAGVAYNPLGDMPDDSVSSSDEEDNDQTLTTKPAQAPPASVPEAPHQPEVHDTDDEPPLSDVEEPAEDSRPASSALPAAQPQKQNYFNDQPITTIAESAPPSQDPILLGAIKRAAAMSADESANPSAEPISDTAKRLLARDRDMDDLDMGFGSSRFGDEEDDEEGGSKMKLSEWKGGLGGEEDEEEGEGRSRGGGKQRKRGKKKRKGDKDSAADVMRVLEGRRAAG